MDCCFLLFLSILLQGCGIILCLSWDYFLSVYETQMLMKNIPRSSYQVLWISIHIYSQIWEISTTTSIVITIATSTAIATSTISCTLLPPQIWCYMSLYIALCVLYMNCLWSIHCPFRWFGIILWKVFACWTWSLSWLLMTKRCLWLCPFFCSCDWSMVGVGMNW